ncbi:MAG: Alkylhydroperoxidase AhpD core domain [uncultured Cytophagales bacterium]|uniref:Alkylhydroperoxidase AhpD core domain n=1 Tax=uncultured Cytophagales bacterium TaxID=158755 RepID=A0A6J4KIB3_9SPHI|nr:MAG: Alkylhydroperoxidase AhpD core domain [uncultured Cytophagales bacterium]
MNHFAVPTREDVSPQNQALFDNLNGALGFVPNLYATIAYSGNALNNYLQLQHAKTSLSKKEKEVVNLVVSQVNECEYCLAAHTALGKMNGLTDGQILEIRQGSAGFHARLDALVKLTREITLHKGRIAEAHLAAFYAAGYTKESLVDVMVAIGDKVIMNYLHNLTQVPIDFPPAPRLTPVAA